MSDFSLSVRLDELLPTKEAARHLPAALRRLEGGEVDRFVLTTRNKPRGVLLTVATYERLLDAVGRGSA